MYNTIFVSNYCFQISKLLPKKRNATLSTIKDGQDGKNVLKNIEHFVLKVDLYTTFLYVESKFKVIFSLLSTI